MVTQASQLPPDTEFATKADLEQVVQTLSRELRSEIEASEQRFLRQRILPLRSMRLSSACVTTSRKH